MRNRVSQLRSVRGPAISSSGMVFAMALRSLVCSPATVSGGVGARRVYPWRIVQEDGSTLRRLISDAAGAGRRLAIEAEAHIFGLKVE